LPLWKWNMYRTVVTKCKMYAYNIIL